MVERTGLIACGDLVGMTPDSPVRRELLSAIETALDEDG